jgi:hypothetical protein
MFIITINLCVLNKWESMFIFGFLTQKLWHFGAYRKLTSENERTLTSPCDPTSWAPLSLRKFRSAYVARRLEIGVHSVLLHKVRRKPVCSTCLSVHLGRWRAQCHCSNTGMIMKSDLRAVESVLNESCTERKLVLAENGCSPENPNFKDLY